MIHGSSGPIHRHWVLISFFHSGVWDSMWFYVILCDSMGFYVILLDSVGFCGILWDSMGFYGILLDSVGFCGVIGDSWRIYRILRDSLWVVLNVPRVGPESALSCPELHWSHNNDLEQVLWHLCWAEWVRGWIYNGTSSHLSWKFFCIVRLFVASVALSCVALI